MENKKTRKNGAQDNEHLYHCPMCGSTDLEVIDCRVIGHMELTDEGFIPEGDTTDEIILCRFCSHKDKMQRFMDSKNTQKQLTIREIVKEYPELYDYDYKWRDSDNYRNLAEVLKKKGFEFVEEEVRPGEYNDIKAYFECKVRKKSKTTKETTGTIKEKMWSYIRSQELPLGFIEGLDDDFGRISVEYGIVVWANLKVTCLGDASAPIDVNEGVPTIYTLSLVDLAKVIEKGKKPGEDEGKYEDEWEYIEKLTGGIR